MKRGTVLIMAGGTGGHVFPALAAARVLRERGYEPVWLGTQRGLEAKLVPPQQIEIEWISDERAARQRRRDLARRAVQAVARDLAEPAGDASPAAERRARRGRLRFGSGRRRGVADAPAAGDPRAERGRRHDQSHARASRAPRARSVSRELSVRARTPSASAIRCVARSLRCAAPAQRFAQRSGPLRLLVFGGSQGAARLNAVVPAALAMIDVASRPLVIHQAGERHHRAGAASCTRSTACRPTCAPSSTTWRKRTRWADLVVCRSGALTVSELAAAGLPAIFVPFAAAVDDHQTLNAKFLVDAQAGSVDRRSAS